MFVSYAQNFEDVLLHRVFGGQETGFYVDVGAYHPVIGSITKTFYDRGWSGINIEPGSVFSELASARRRDVNLQMAVLDRVGEVTFVEDEADRGMSHVSADDDGDGPRRTVRCDTLAAIVRAHSRGRPVDFVKVDAEGAEAAIVCSTDWRILRPRVLLVEATLPWSSKLVNQEWEPKLLEQGYVRAYFDGINCFYIPEEETPGLLQYFQVPVNALDQVIQHDHDALRKAMDDQHIAAIRIATESDAIRAVLDEQKRDNGRLLAERDALRAVADDRQKEAIRVLAECDALRAEGDALRAERDALRAERDALRAERDAIRMAFEDKQREAAQIVAERDSARLDASRSANLVRELEVGRPPGIARVGGLTERGATRRAALIAYRLVRPVVRPLAWRLRSFMISGLAEQLPQLMPSMTSSPVYVGNDGAAANEMRRLAEEMERTLLTLAMERTPDSWSAGLVDRADVVTLSKRVALLLPRGRTTEVECASGDLSISAALVASRGDWEPHVRHYLETLVRPDWVCIDIGANIGAHTLSLASLAHNGRVVAFEADAANFELLQGNVRTLAPPSATIETVHAALWDDKCTLICGGADELAGCSFVGDDMANSALVERRLRSVVHSSEVDRTAFHIRLHEVAALPLDAWLEDNPLPRLDLIKLDVEGAEVRVIRGAETTLRLHRPVLLVEYNPACAEAYFGQSPDVLFRELEARFDVVNALEPDGRLTPIADWAALQARLAAGKGWEDLVCLPGPW